MKLTTNLKEIDRDTNYMHALKCTSSGCFADILYIDVCFVSVKSARGCYVCCKVKGFKNNLRRSRYNWCSGVDWTKNILLINSHFLGNEKRKANQVSRKIASNSNITIWCNQSTFY